jgi:membrane-associated phospholipid phosphatase
VDEIDGAGASGLRPAVRTAGLPAVVATVGVAVFIALLVTVERGAGLVQLDPHVMSGVLDLRTPAITAAVQVVTFLGSASWLTGVTVVSAVVLVRAAHPVRAAIVLAAMAASAAATIVIKSIVARPRPGTLVELGAPETSFSFPSGHTLNSTVCYGILVLMVVPLLRSVSARTTVTSSAVLVIVAIGLSRLYLGHHWASDVLAGWVLGLSILALATAAAAVWLRPPRRAVTHS